MSWKVSRSWSSSAGSGRLPRSTLPATVDSVSASARARAASRVRRAASSTTVLTAAATSRKTTRARMFSPAAMVHSWIGGVKYQFSSRKPATAATSAG